METPLSTRRITRSQSQAISGCENQESVKGVLNSRQESGKHQEREKSALIDITNGSPIVGLAMGSLKTPSSTRSWNRMMIPKAETRHTMTPGSGESLLRGQVRTLLQKVEEEGVISKFCFDHKPLIRKRFVNSPMVVLAPTPANTPQIYGVSSANNVFDSFSVSPVAESFTFTQMLNEVISSPSEEDNDETDEKNVITRSLLMDFSEKSDGCDSSDCNSLLTCKGSDSDSSVWSIQVNASTNDDYKEDENTEEYKEIDDDALVEELCEGIRKISVNNGVKFTGKHTRFVYNSDGELEGVLESSSSLSSESASGVLCLKGLPTPKGKHLRFVEESEDEGLD